MTRRRRPTTSDWLVWCEDYYTFHATKEAANQRASGLALDPGPGVCKLRHYVISVEGLVAALVNVR